MSKPLPSVSRLSRLDGIERITEIRKWAPGRTDPIIYSVIDFQGDHSNRHLTQENQLVPYERHSRSHRLATTTASGKGDPGTKPIAPSSRFHFANTYDNELVSNLRIQENGEDNRRISGTADYRSGQEKIMAQQQFDAIWDPAQNRDLTVHLKMDVQGDLSDILEEFCCLQRLGDFSSARRYFEENLRDHFDDPYVLVQYGEMLLEQGNYSDVAKLGPLNQYELGAHGPERNRTRLLSDYWDSILFFAGFHHINRRPKDFTPSKEMLRFLHENVMRDERNITSTEIKYLALSYQLCGIRHPEVAKKGLTETLHRSFPSVFHKKLYQSLLRQGRIWDLRDIIVARMATGSPWTVSAAWSTNADFRVRLHDLLTEWTVPTAGYDTPTLLALLDILISLVCWDEYSEITSDILAVAAQIARLIINNDPEAMKTRPFVEWMLAECANAELGSHYQLRRQEDHLAISPGVLYRRTRRNLAQYVPFKTENPGWICEDGPSELRNSARSALRISMNLEDYRTQAKTLQLLILMSANPIKEFEELGKLQKFSQGDNYNFSETLAAKYLVLNDDESKQKLKNELADQWCIPGFSSSLSAHQLWILSILRYALARDDVEAERALREADAWYRDSPSKFVEYVNKQMPTQRDARRRNNETRTARLDPTERRRYRRITSFSPSPEPRRRSKAGLYGGRGIEDWGEPSDDEWESTWQRGGRLETFAGIRDNWKSRATARTPEDTIIRVPEPISRLDEWSSRPHPASRVARRPTMERMVVTRDNDIKYTRERSLDESDLSRGRSLYRDLGDIHALSSRQQPPIVGSGAPGTQIPGRMPLRTTGAAGGNTLNHSGHPDTTSTYQSTHDHPQASTSFGPIDDASKHAQNAVQTNSNQASPDEYALVPLRGNYEPDTIEDEGKDTNHETSVKPKQPTMFAAGSQTDFDTFKPPSRAVTMERVKDVGEDAEAVGSPISTGSDQD